MLKAILFDLDETLFDRRATMRAAAEDQYRRLCRDAAFSENAFVEKLLELDDYGRAPKRAVFAALVVHFDIRGPTWQELLADRDAATIRGARLHDGAAACLEGLTKDGYRLGLVTNGRVPMQHDKAVAAGIAPFFATIVVSEAEGVEKPDPRIFRSALSRLAVEPDEALFVGDDPENDIRGAQAVGMKAVFVASFHHASCDFADAAVENLSGVRGAVRRLFPKPRVKDPLEGKTLEAIVTELVEGYGWRFLAGEIAINCFSNEPSIQSSLKFLRRTPWARAKVEALYRQLTATGP